jgi:hypothetical protein
MKRINLVGIVMAALLLAACGAGKPGVEEVLAGASATMAAVDTLQFTLERVGDPVMLIPEQNIAALGADGMYRAPDEVYALLKIQIGGLVGEAEVVWNASGVYFKLPPLQPEYGPIDLEGTFNPTDIFDPAAGIPYILTDVLTGAKLGRDEDIDGVPCYHITAEAEGASISALIGGVALADTISVDLWIDKSTQEIVRITLTEADESSWIIDLYGYGEAVEIPAAP